MSLALNGFLLLLAVLSLAWGFERYRSRFVKTDLLIGVGLAIGFILVVFVPSVFDWIGGVLDIQRRVITLSLLANVVLLLLALYLGAVVRRNRSDINELIRNLSIDQAPRTDGGNNLVNVVIPAYNEAETIGEVLRELPGTINGHRVEPIVVSDGSVDETVEEAEINGSTVVKHHLNQGQGGALLTGFEIAVRNQADIVVTMDADGQHPASELSDLVKPIIDDEADFVMGSRYRGADRSGNGVVRRAGIWAFTWLINVLTKSSITDCTNGYRAIRGSALGEMSLTEEQFSAPELIIEARKQGLRVKEIPITVRERGSGRTKKPKLGYALGLTRTILATWVR
jgi:hypothetical protein